MKCRCRCAMKGGVKKRTNVVNSTAAGPICQSDRNESYRRQKHSKISAAALIDALPASMRKMQAATRDLAIDNNLTRVRGSLALSRSYEDSHIDANSLVRDNREWLRVRVDAFCGAFFS